MIKITPYFLFLFSFFYVNAQEKREIDSINAISFEEKLKKATILDEVYLKNARDAEKIKYVFGTAESYSNLSLVYYYQGKYEKDILYSLKAINLFDKINDKEKLAYEYGELGYRMKKRNLNKALFYLQIGKSISEKNLFKKNLLSIYNNYGVLKEMQKEYDSALYFYQKGLTLKKSMNDSIGIPYSLNNIAGVYVIQKKFNKALPLYEKALKIRILKKDQIGITENYQYFGNMYFADQNYKTAIVYYQKTLENALKYKYIDLIQFSYLKLSESYEKLNNTEESFKNFKKFSQYKDSLINKETNSKIAELEIRFETDKNEKLLLQNKIASKKKTTAILILILFVIFIIIFGVLFYRQERLKNKQLKQEFYLKSKITLIESQNKLHEQRLAISRDLHDNIGAQLTFIISSVENLKHTSSTLDDRVITHLTKISDFTKTTIVELRDTIWAMSANEFRFDDLSSRIYNFIEKAQFAKEQIKFEFTIDNSAKAITFSSVEGINLYRTIQEAVNNAIKYANAPEISVEVSKVDNQIKIEITDNGKGFDINNVILGYGILNMKKRIEEIKGIFQLHSEILKGTQITISLFK